MHTCTNILLQILNCQDPQNCGIYICNKIMPKTVRTMVILHAWYKWQKLLYKC